MTTQKPDVTDFARISPPWASINLDRSPVLRWHDTRGGAKVSAAYNSTEFLTNEMTDYRRRVKVGHGIARLLPDGSMEIVEWSNPGEERPR